MYQGVSLWISGQEGLLCKVLYHCNLFSQCVVSAVAGAYDLKSMASIMSSFEGFWTVLSFKLRTVYKRLVVNK